MIKVLLNGSSGKMGKEVINCIKSDDNFSIIAGIDKNIVEDNSFITYTDINLIPNLPDVIIDFSCPLASLKVLEFAKEKKTPVVIATTGFTDEQLKIIKDYSNYIPVFKSANMSFEINLMLDILSKVTNVLKDSDIEIIETHHNKKVDAPSGTSILLADKINETLNNEMEYKFNRHDDKIARSKKEIGIHSIRGGTEVGKHSVIFFGDNESLEITHNVTSRSVFAKGSLKAAKFIVNQSSGLYDMSFLI